MLQLKYLVQKISYSPVMPGFAPQMCDERDMPARYELRLGVPEHRLDNIVHEYKANIRPRNNDGTTRIKQATRKFPGLPDLDHPALVQRSHSEGRRRSFAQDIHTHYGCRLRDTRLGGRLTGLKRRSSSGNLEERMFLLNEGNFREQNTSLTSHGLTPSATSPASLSLAGDAPADASGSTAEDIEAEASDDGPAPGVSVGTEYRV